MAEKKTNSNQTTKRGTASANKSAAKQTTAKSSAGTSTSTHRSSAKPASAAKNQPARSTSGRSGGAAVSGKSKQVRLILITVLSALFILALVIGIAAGANSCNSADTSDGSLSDVTITPPENEDDYNSGSNVKPDSEYDDVEAGKENYFENDPGISKIKYDVQNAKTNTAVGYYSHVVGSVERNVPEHTRDEGLAAYPKYGHSLSTVLGNSDEQKAARSALIYEASYLTAAGTINGGAGGYTWMDKDGFLYSGTTAEPVQTLDKSGHHRRLYKHSASVGLYGGDVSKDEPAIIKTVTMRPRGYTSYGVTGVYAPAGEVIKITLGEEDMNATGGIVIHIGQALYNGKANNIWVEKNQMPRIAVLLNTMTVDKSTSVYDETSHTYTAYVGSFIGGPLYIRNENVTFSATISGGVAYPHFILGYTTEEEFNENAKSSAPYFDLEVWHNGVLHSGPKRNVSSLTYDEVYKAAVLWDKVASVTTTNSNQGIVFLYDPFVAAGAAVAFPGQSSVNCPESWMFASFNYEGIVTSGAWGNFHEYHHNFQNYGVGAGGEVTNNGMTLVSYALFTKISAQRGIANYGAQNLGDWNNYTSATWALNDILKISRGQTPANGNKGLALYATLLHNFGADNYIQAKVTQQKRSYGESYVGYLKAWQDVTHNDMTYYFKDILNGITEEQAAQLKNDGYSKFVPVSCVYQTGRSYMFGGEKRYIKTMRPYAIVHNSPYVLDLNPYTVNDSGQYSGGSIVLPDGFSYTIKNITKPENGTISYNAQTRLATYTPDNNGKSSTSGQFTVTLGITKDGDSSFKVDDIDLTLELELSRELNKTKLERTVYKFDEGNMYADAQTAYENGFAGFSAKQTIEHTNPTQNANTDIWFYPSASGHESSPEHHIVHVNQIDVLDGKLFAADAGKYRIYLRGRANCALYYSSDGVNYTLGATIKDRTNANGSYGGPGKSYLFRPEDENSYFDLELQSGSFVYIREVLIEQSSPVVSFVGVGMKKWTPSVYTVVDKYYDKNGNEVASADDPAYDHTVTRYYNAAGEEVTEEQANGAAATPPVIAENSQPYATAYRPDYEPSEESGFETEYYYIRKYNYNYTDNKMLGGDNKKVVEEQCENLNLSTR